jgi:hypothetical protein
LAQVPALHQVTIALLELFGHAQQVGWQSASDWHGCPGITLPGCAFDRLQSFDELEVLPMLVMPAASTGSAQVVGVGREAVQHVTSAANVALIAGSLNTG